MFYSGDELYTGFGDYEIADGDTYYCGYCGICHSGDCIFDYDEEEGEE